MEYWSLLCYLSAFIDGVKSHTEYFLQMYPLFCRCLSMLIFPLKPWICLTRICMVVYLYKHVCLYVRIHTTQLLHWLNVHICPYKKRTIFSFRFKFIFFIRLSVNKYVFICFVARTNLLILSVEWNPIYQIKSYSIVQRHKCE